MKLLNELNQISNLSASQKAVLAISKFSATPKQAYAATTGSDKLVYARDSLVRMGFVTLNNAELTLTQNGDNATVQYNLVDETGQPTDETVSLLKAFHSDDEVTDQQQNV